MPSVFCYNPLRTHLEILNPDASGFGELCITMLDRHAVIPLPRYATGDLGRLLNPQETARAAALAGTEPPWLPLVAVQGRIKDRSSGLPSVESIKELLYLDHAIADQLSGAFRLASNGSGRTRLTLQANTAAAVAPALRMQLTELCTRQGLADLEVDVVEPEDFPWRPLLDFERKFAYVAPPPGDRRWFLHCRGGRPDGYENIHVFQLLRERWPLGIVRAFLRSEAV